MNNLIIKLNDANSLQKSQEGVKINKFQSSISPLNFIKLIHKADNKVNPRNAKENRVTKSIHETLEKSPELFWLKSKGILLATESCKVLERNRVEISLVNVDYEGIMDGGHNALAIAIFLIEQLFDEKIKTWEECKEFWNDNYEDILKEFQSRESEFQFSIPLEIVTPNDEDGSIEEYYDYLSEICSARNNNVQLTETAKGNKVGYYDYLKELLEGKFDIIWKSGDAGKIKSEDVISLATLPLIFLQQKGLLPNDIKNLNKINIYSQKSRCVDFYNSVLENPNISDEVKGKAVLKDSYVKSALEMIEEILCFFDRMFIEFPNLYHDASPGKFGRITVVSKKQTKIPFNSTDEMAQYQYSFGFIYPLITGLTSLMDIDESTKKIFWKIKPSELDLSELDLTQYVNIIKLVNFDPQKIGKGEVFYNEAESTFGKVIA